MTSSHDVSASPVLSRSVISLFNAIGLQSENDLSPVFVQPSPGPLHTTSRNSVPAEGNQSHCKCRTKLWKPFPLWLIAWAHCTRTQPIMRRILRTTDCHCGEPRGRRWNGVGLGVWGLGSCLCRYSLAAAVGWRTDAATGLQGSGSHSEDAVLSERTTLRQRSKY